MRGRSTERFGREKHAGRSRYTPCSYCQGAWRVGCSWGHVAHLEAAGRATSCLRSLGAITGALGQHPTLPGAWEESSAASRPPESAAVEYNLTSRGKRCQTNLCARRTRFDAHARAASCKSISCHALAARSLSGEEREAAGATSTSRRLPSVLRVLSYSGVTEKLH